MSTTGSAKTLLCYEPGQNSSLDYSFLFNKCTVFNESLNSKTFLKLFYFKKAIKHKLIQGYSSIWIYLPFSAFVSVNSSVPIDSTIESLFKSADILNSVSF